MLSSITLERKQSICTVITTDTQQQIVFFKNCIDIAYARYYSSNPDSDINIQEEMTCMSFVAKHERSLANVIKRFSMPAETPWYLVDEVYIPVNSSIGFICWFTENP